MVGLLFVVLVAIGLIGASPLALTAFNGAANRWQRLSFIGQTYGAASAVLSVLAVIGVAATLVFQARESKAAREQAIRDSNTELLRMAMDDPDLNECWGASAIGGSFRQQRQRMYVNLILSQWEMAYETRALGEKHLRAMAGGLFSGPIGHDFWRIAREGRIATAESKRARRFQHILDEEYHRASPGVASPKAMRAESPRKERTESSRRRGSSWWFAGAGALVGGAVTWTAGRLATRCTDLVHRRR